MNWNRVRRETWGVAGVGSWTPDGEARFNEFADLQRQAQIASARTRSAATLVRLADGLGPWRRPDGILEGLVEVCNALGRAAWVPFRPLAVTGRPSEAEAGHAAVVLQDRLIAAGRMDFPDIHAAAVEATSDFADEVGATLSATD